MSEDRMNICLATHMLGPGRDQRAGSRGFWISETARTHAHTQTGTRREEEEVAAKEVEGEPPTKANSI